MILAMVPRRIRKTILKNTLSGWEKNMRKLIPCPMQQRHQTPRKEYSEKMATVDAIMAIDEENNVV